MFGWRYYDAIRRLEAFLYWTPRKCTCTDCGQTFTLGRYEEYTDLCSICAIKRDPSGYPPEMVKKYLGTPQ